MQAVCEHGSALMVSAMRLFDHNNEFPASPHLGDLSQATLTCQRKCGRLRVLSNITSATHSGGRIIEIYHHLLVQLCDKIISAYSVSEGEWFSVDFTVEYEKSDFNVTVTISTTCAPKSMEEV